MRQIDADALKAEWYKINDIGPEDRGARFVGYSEIARLIDNAPTVEPGGDCISRADAVKTVIRKCSPICDWQDGTQQYPDCVVAEINALPSAEAEWIPCSDRLPSESGWYLITVQGCEKVADMEWYYSEWDAWNGVSSEQQVIAWMPLPKPYKGGDTE